MGGYGSTRWNSYYKKTTIEECKILPITLFKKPIKHVLENPYEKWAGSVNWSCGGEPTGMIGYLVFLENCFPKITLQYKFVESGLEMEYPITLTNTILSWEKNRWWFVCPLNKDGFSCKNRVGKLYLPPGGKYFGCRHCYNLTYSSCQEAHKFDSFYKQFTIGMNETIPGFSFRDAKSVLEDLEKRYERESILDSINGRLAELEEKERKKKKRLAKYLTADELCRQSGLTKEELERLGEFRLLVPDTSDGKYRPKLVNWACRLKYKINQGWNFSELKKWSKERWKI